MIKLPEWTRRQFLLGSAATAAFVHPDAGRAWDQQARKAPQSAGASPEEISGGIQPLLEYNTARPLRYRPHSGDFVIRNGREFFNRPVYGPNNPFRVDAGDLPEFSLYLPGHGGNLRLGIIAPHGSKWLFAAAEVVARYRPGRMIYEIGDSLLESGSLHLELLTHGTGSGIMLSIEHRSLPPNLSLAFAFGGVSGRKGRRNGDIGCEIEPVGQFFQLRPEECASNHYEVERETAHLYSRVADLLLRFPPGARLHLADAACWNEGPAQLLETSAHQLPVIAGILPLRGEQQLFLSIERLITGESNSSASLPEAFAARSRQVELIGRSVMAETPDEYVNAAARALACAADALWDERQGCLMHGAVAWRSPFAGWRGPYVLDALGSHERMRHNLRHWIARQNTAPVTAPSPAVGPADPGTHLTRKEDLLHSSGDLSHNHYDMNLVFFDGLLRHLRWTGDLDFAREVWPAFVRHLAWERRLFRRVFTAEDGRELPLYEAYACIWASDNLQYNGGGAAHSSAYNYFAHRRAAEIARLLGEDPAHFDNEASLILLGMQHLLWLRDQGAFAEAKDILTDQTLYSSPTLWTVYHCIDSEVPDPCQAWQMASERLHALRPVPIHGPAVPEGDWYLLSCSDWLPYEWSLNLLALAENMHMALALWQAGMCEEAFGLFNGNLLDSMYQGLCPGNFHMSSQLDVHRQESQRDFGDPIGISSRALIEGLFGIRPDLLHRKLTIRPGFPSAWDKASLEHPNLSFAWRRKEMREQFTIDSRLSRPASLLLLLPAATTSKPTVLCDGQSVPCSFDVEAVGRPLLRIELAPASRWSLEIRWQGEAPPAPPTHRSYSLGQRIDLPPGTVLSDLDDPQQCLEDGRTVLSGHHTVFARKSANDCRWILPISFTVEDASHGFRPVTTIPSGSRSEALNLDQHLTGNITDIFRRPYSAPRSPYCSLSVPDQGIGGWANFDPQPEIDDAGLRAAGGLLHTPLGISFRTPEAGKSNCLFLSQWRQDQPRFEFPLHGHARSIYLLLAGTTLPRASHMVHGTVKVRYRDGQASTLTLKNPETWWPIERDYLLDDYLFRNKAPLPPRVDLRTGQVRLLNRTDFLGRGRTVPGGAATILQLPLDSHRQLASLTIEASLYGIVIALLAATLVRAG